MKVAGRFTLLMLCLVFGLVPGLASGASLIEMTAPFTLTATLSDEFGTSVAGGDLNADGVPDIIVGAPGALGGRGQVSIYSGKDGTLLYTIAGEPGRGRFGISVAGADVDGDGAADLVVGAMSAGPGGRVYVYSGRLLSLVPPPEALLYLLDSPVANAHFGRVLDAADFTRDGHADLLIAASKAGRAYVFSGARLSASGTQTQALLYTFSNASATGGFASCLGLTDDVDGDGTPDILIGTDAAGIAWVYSGADGHLLYRLPASGQMGQNFSRSVAGADFTGDGLADLVVGAIYATTATCPDPHRYAGCDRTGRVYIYAGATGELLYTLDGLRRGGGFGFVSVPGDIDRDGTPDLLVTAPFLGEGYLLSGARLGLGVDGALLFSFTGGMVGWDASRFVGDLNHDTVPDLVVGAPGDGQVLVFLSPPPPHRADTTPPVILYTVSPEPNAAGWHTSDVTIGWDVTDPESGVASALGCGQTTLTTETAGTLLTCSATNGAGLSASVSVTVKIDRTPPEAATLFDPAIFDLVVFGRDALSGVPEGPIGPVSITPTRWSGDDDEADEPANAELRTYLIQDAAGNTLRIEEKIKREGHELKARIMSLQYHQDPLFTLPRNKMAFEWALKGSSLKELEQKITLGQGQTKQKVQAKFEAKKNQTTIKVTDLVKTKAVRPGLVLLRLATARGALVIEY